MNEQIERLQTLDKYKTQIIEKINKITHTKFSKSQAQKLLAYSNQTNSIEEILLYLKYQGARIDDAEETCNKLSILINEYKDSGIHVIRYLLSAFTRRVVILEKSGSAK